MTEDLYLSPGSQANPEMVSVTRRGKLISVACWDVSLKDNSIMQPKLLLVIQSKSKDKRKEEVSFSPIF